MANNIFSLYLFTFLAALILSLILTPAARSAAILFNIFDHPSSNIKTHREPVPYLGGAAIFISFIFALLWIRVLTSFPTGTLRALRGILFGGAFIFILGLVDDIRPEGLHYRTKFMFQISGAIMLILFGIHIKFVHPSWLAIILSVVWIVGITNAFNLIDIMDGLAGGITIMASLAFLFISLPTEEIYVNFAATALAGSVLGFLPYNLSKGWKIFMGDSGSLFIGFIAGSLALGTSYGKSTPLGVLAPLFILALPIFDTFLVFYTRIKKGVSPFQGSKDHFPFRLEKLGWSRPAILGLAMALSGLCGLAAYLVTRVNTSYATAVYVFTLVVMALFAAYVLKARVK